MNVSKRPYTIKRITRRQAMASYKDYKKYQIKRTYVMNFVNALLMPLFNFIALY